MLKVVLSWSAIILGVFIVMTLFRTQEGTEYDLEYTKYVELMKTGNIASATIRKSDQNNFDFHGVLKQPIDLDTPSGKKVHVEKFVVTLPFLDNSVIQEWAEKDIRFTITKDDNTWMNALLGALPWILLLVVWLIIMRRMQGMGTQEENAARDLAAEALKL